MKDSLDRFKKSLQDLVDFKYHQNLIHVAFNRTTTSSSTNTKSPIYTSTDIRETIFESKYAITSQKFDFDFKENCETINCPKCKTVISVEKKEYYIEIVPTKLFNKKLKLRRLFFNKKLFFLSIIIGLIYPVKILLEAYSEYNINYTIFEYAKMVDIHFGSESIISLLIPVSTYAILKILMHQKFKDYNFILLKIDKPINKNMCFKVLHKIKIRNISSEAARINQKRDESKKKILDYLYTHDIDGNNKHNDIFVFNSDSVFKYYNEEIEEMIKNFKDLRIYYKPID